MEQAKPLGRGSGDRAALLAITLITLAAAILVHSIDDIPLIDDWTYAWSGEHFLQTGELRMLEWSAHYPLAQIIWGAVFSHIFGFSFFTLRVSTLVLEWAGLLAFFFTLRTLGIAPLLGALGTLALFFNPVLFVLSHSFMTDVPFVSVMNLATLYYVRWAQRRKSLDLGLGSFFATMSFLTRQIGAALSLVPLVYLLLSRMLGRERHVRRDRSPFEDLDHWHAMLLPSQRLGEYCHANFLLCAVADDRARRSTHIAPEGA